MAYGTYVLEHEAVDVDQLLLEVRRHVGRGDPERLRRLPLAGALPLPGRRRRRRQRLLPRAASTSERDAALRRVGRAQLRPGRVPPRRRDKLRPRRRDRGGRARVLEPVLLLLARDGSPLPLPRRARRRLAARGVARRPGPSRVGRQQLPLPSRPSSRVEQVVRLDGAGASRGGRRRGSRAREDWIGEETGGEG
jgi:hypothetical protein